MTPASLPSGPPEEPRIGPLPTRRTAVALFLLAVASLPWLGYRFGGSNQSIQLVLLKHQMDPTLYAGDPLVSSFHGYATCFTAGMVLAARVVGSVELAYFLVYAAVHYLTLLALWALAVHFLSDRAGAALVCLLYLLNPLSLGGESCLNTRLLHGNVAAALLLWVLWLSLRGRTLPAFGLTGLAFNIHALYALYVASMLGVDGLLHAAKRGWGAFLKGCGLFLLLALPTAVWIVRSQEAMAPESRSLWLQIMRERSALHTFPLSQPAEYYASYLLLVALGVLGLLGESVGSRRAWLCFAGAVAALCLAGLVFSEWLPLVGVIKAQPLRSTKWLTYLLLIPLARLLTSAWERGPAARAACLAAGLGLLVREPGLLAVSLALFLLAEPGRWTGWGVLFGAAALVAGGLGGATALPPLFGLRAAAGRIGALVESPEVLAGLGLYAWHRSRAAAEPTGRRSVTASAVALLGGALLMARVYDESVKATERVAWNELQAWVRANTPKDAVFLTPPYGEGFRVFSERAIVGEWKDGTQQFFSPRFGFEWAERMKRLEAPGDGYDRLDAAALLALARDYGARYIVTRPHSRYDLPRVFKNPAGVVYRAGPVDGAGPAP